MTLRLRSNLLALILLLSGLALAASWRPEAEPIVDGRIPRVTVGGVGLGDSLADVTGKWGVLEPESPGFVGGVYFFPTGSVEHPGDPLLSQKAECGPLGRVVSVRADSLEIGGQVVLRQSDPVTWVEQRLGPPLRPNLRARCGSPTFRTWTYRTGSQRYTVYAFDPRSFGLPEDVDPASVPELNTIQGFHLEPADTQGEGSGLDLY